MATAFRSAQSVTNGTAGTSVTVSKPAGIVDTGATRDQLIAYIASTGAPTVTAPAGWTLITSVAASTSVKISVYRKLASSEGSSWTWTLGTSQRNWGWVGAYTGVDPTTPVVGFATTDVLGTSTVLMPSTPFFPTVLSHGQGVFGGAAVRIASGAATTWTPGSSERADLSTNAGSGTDIAGSISDGQNAGIYEDGYAPSSTASQAQTAGAAVSLTLRPYFVPYIGGPLTICVEAAFGADPDSDQSGWTWTPITVYVLEPESGPAVIFTGGKPNATSTADPSKMSLTLKNLAGEWTHPAGVFYGGLAVNLPIRLWVSGFGVDATGKGYHRGTAFLTSAKPRWDSTLNYSVIDVVARGRLWRARQDDQPLHSAAYRTVMNMNGIRPTAYWSGEDKAGADAFVSAVPGVAQAVSAGMTLGFDNSFAGSDTVARLSEASSLFATVPPYTPSNQWTAVWSYRIPAEPVADTMLMTIFTVTGITWDITLVPGTSAIRLSAVDYIGAPLLSTLTGALDESLFYGKSCAFSLGTTKNGTGQDYVFWVLPDEAPATGITLTLASAAHGNVAAFQMKPSAGLDDGAFGHLALYGDFSANPSEALVLPFNYEDAVLHGHAGEWPWARFQRLCTEEGIAYKLGQSSNQYLKMGTQGIGTLADLLAECEAVERNVMHDIGADLGDTGLLTFPSAGDRENRTADLTLSMLPGSGQVSPGFEPTLDDQALVDDVEIKRVAGYSWHTEDAAAVAKYGRRSQVLTLNLFDTHHLVDIAGTILAQGSLGGYRFPTVGWNLRNPNTWAAIEAWLACEVGAKLTVTDPPSQYPPDDIETFVEGYTEEVGTWHWAVRANLSPAELQNVGIMAVDLTDTNPLLGRANWDACVLAEDLTTTEPGVDVTATPLITTDANNCPFDIFIGGERMTVTACVGASNPQTLTVTRSANTVVKAHTTGAPVTLAHPMIATK